jgi:hypothetical protein
MLKGYQSSQAQLCIPVVIEIRFVFSQSGKRLFSFSPYVLDPINENKS